MGRFPFAINFYDFSWNYGSESDGSGYIIIHLPRQTLLSEQKL